MNTTDSNTSTKPARASWTSQDWGALLQLLRLLAVVYDLITKP